MTGAISSVMIASAMNGSGISLFLGVLVAGRPRRAARMGPRGHVPALPGEPDHRRHRDRRLLHRRDAVHHVPGTRHPQNLNGAFPLPVWSVPFFSHIPRRSDPLRPEHPGLRRDPRRDIANSRCFAPGGAFACARSGRSPSPRETVGVSVTRMRYGAVILGGFVAGLGGAAFTIGAGTNFTFGMTNGYGYIALAIMIFGRWRPYGALMASLLFGFTIALSANLNIYLASWSSPSSSSACCPTSSRSRRWRDSSGGFDRPRPTACPSSRIGALRRAPTGIWVRVGVGRRRHRRAAGVARQREGTRRGDDVTMPRSGRPGGSPRCRRQRVRR